MQNYNLIFMNENLQIKKQNIFPCSQVRIIDPILAALGIVNSNLNSQISGIDTQVSQLNSDYFPQIITDLPKPDYSDFITEPNNSLIFSQKRIDLLTDYNFQNPQNSNLDILTGQKTPKININEINYNSQIERQASGLEKTFTQSGLTEEQVEIKEKIMTYLPNLEKILPGIKLIFTNGRPPKEFLLGALSEEKAEVVYRKINSAMALNSSFETLEKKDNYVIAFNLSEMERGQKLEKPIAALLFNEVFDLILSTKLRELNLPTETLYDDLNAAQVPTFFTILQLLYPKTSIEKSFENILLSVRSYSEPFVGSMSNLTLIKNVVIDVLKAFYGEDLTKDLIINQNGILLPSLIKDLTQPYSQNREIKGTSSPDSILIGPNTTDLNTGNGSDTVFLFSGSETTTVLLGKGKGDILYLIPGSGKVFADGGKGDSDEFHLNLNKNSLPVDLTIKDFEKVYFPPDIPFHKSSKISISFSTPGSIVKIYGLPLEYRKYVVADGVNVKYEEHA